MDVNPDGDNMATQPNPTQPNRETKPTQTATREEEPAGPGLP